MIEAIETTTVIQIPPRMNGAFSAIQSGSMFRPPVRPPTIRPMTTTQTAADLQSEDGPRPVASHGQPMCD